MLNKISQYISEVVNGRNISVGNQKARWTKVKNLKTGARIAVAAGQKLEFDEIISIRRVGREQVWDIEVEGSRNFVGNGILAHNTTGKALTILNETGDQNILAASASGVTQFTLSRTGDITLVGDAAINGGDITTTTTTATVFDTTATTLSLGGAATTALNLGNGSGNYTAINLGSGAGTHVINIAGTGATAADTINIGTGGTGADTINLGSSASTTALNFTSGTGAQTFASSMATGNAFAFTANSLSTGLGLYLSSTSTALSSGSLASLDWSPGSATTATGDLLKLNIGANGLIGNIFNVLDNGSSVFSVSQTAITAGLPASFTAAGDVSLAYDLLFTNQTASYLKSNGPLYLDTGEIWESNDLTFQTYNAGNIIANTQALAINGSATISGQLVIGTATAPANIGNFYLTNSAVFGKALAILNQTESQDIFTASASGVAKFVITSAGNVGIGTTLPTNLLHVVGSSTATASAMLENTSTTAATVGLAIKMSATTLDTTSRFINFLDKSGIVIGKINAANTTTVAYSANGTDMAEYFIKNDETFSSGDVVSTSNSDLTKTSVSYDAKMIGIVSTAPSFVGGEEGTNKVLVAIVGQVPVKIAASSPAIAKGDFVTSSIIAGRATKAITPGFVIGKALEDWNPTTGEDQILIYVNNTWADPNNSFASDIASISAQLTDLRSQILDASNPAASLSAELWQYATESGKLATVFPVQVPELSVTGKLTVGLLSFDDLESSISSLTGTITIKGDLAVSGTIKVLGTSAGKAIIPAGSTSLTISNDLASSTSAIFATPEKIPVAISTESLPADATQSALQAGGKFVIRIPDILDQDLKVNWWIVN